MNPLSIFLTLTDTHGDELHVRFNEPHDKDGLELVALKDRGYVDPHGPNDWLLDEQSVRELRNALDVFLGEGTRFDPNAAKLELAAQLGLRAKFAYRGDRDYRATERRIEPEKVYDASGNTYVAGESYDEGGEAEGYRQFRLDRISGEVSVR